MEESERKGKECLGGIVVSLAAFRICTPNTHTLNWTGYKESLSPFSRTLPPRKYAIDLVFRRRRRRVRKRDGLSSGIHGKCIMRTMGMVMYGLYLAKLNRIQIGAFTKPVMLHTHFFLPKVSYICSSLSVRSSISVFGIYCGCRPFRLYLE